MSSSLVASTTPPALQPVTALSPSGSPTDTMNPTLHDSVHLPGELQPLEAAGTTRAVRRETTGGSSDPHDPVARDAGEGDPAEAVLLGSAPPLVSAVDPRAVEPRHQPLSSQGARVESTPCQQPIRDQHSDATESTLPSLHAAQPASTRRVVDLSDPLPSTVPTLTPPTYASVMRRGGQASKGSVKVTLCRPTRANLAKLLELASDEETSDDAMFQAIEDALSYPKRIGTTTFWIDTSDALMSQTNDKIIKSLFEDNKDAPWAHLMQDFVQVNKARGGDVVVTVTDEATRLGMSGQSIRRVLCTRFNFDARAVLNALRRLKTNPVFISYKLAYSSSTQKSNTHPNIWRVYFNTPSEPAALLVKGHPVDQIMLHGVHYGVFVKDYQPAPTRNGRRQTHCIDLDKLLVTPTTFPEPQTQEGENKRAKVHATDALPTPVPLLEEHSWAPTADTPITTDITMEEETTQVDLDAPDVQTSTEVFQSMVDGMEVDDFEKPRKPLKRTREEKGDPKLTWVTDNMYDALSHVNVNSRTVPLPQYLPVNSYCMDIIVPSSTMYHSRTSIRRMRTRASNMQWHPNNLTMKEIIATLNMLGDEHDADVAHTKLTEAAATDPVDIAPLLLGAKAVELWKWINTDPYKANCDLTRVFLEEPKALRVVAHLHAWHRWLVASALPKVTPFHTTFETVFGRKPNEEFMRNAFPHSAQISATLPQEWGVPIEEVELALSAFEILLATQMAPYFFEEAWLVCVTKQPVVWLPVNKTYNMVAPDTLWNLLHSTVGHHLVTQMRTTHPGELMDTLAHLQAHHLRYETYNMLMFVPGPVPTLAFGTPYRM
ncbi:hypothetical protein DYB36_005716 [Aphanomyces astaci]|uniref:Uncharacterized protein n=1 Tax=Aphanomyces astaci TaxID=112090 RepID=A0A397BGH2_APHAT|nr:hypothetical protein DYB36_005716 [Aphanomyces astaci]